jgi:glycolate oxidase FAD binding subunit
MTLVQACSAAEAIERLNRVATEPRPLSGAAWLDHKLYLRLGGAGSAVDATRRQWGGDLLDGDAEFWSDLAEQRLPWFDSDLPLWRFSMQSTAPLATLDAPWLVDWAGAQRWLLGDFDRAALTPIAERAGGHVTLYRRGERTDEVHHDLAEPLKALHLKLKSAFDPDRIFNPGRLYRWL